MRVMIERILWLIILAICMELRSAEDHDKRPEQVHIAIGEKSQDMVITWNTQSPVPTPTAIYSIYQQNVTKSATGTTQILKENGTLLAPVKRKIYIHRVTLSGLRPNTKYVYTVGGTEGWSKEYWFMTWPSGTNWSPRLYVYGDMGTHNAVSVPKLIKDVHDHKIDAVIHVGDLAYNMNDDGGKVGDDFMRMIEPIAAYVPYMVCPGNHEAYRNFSHYRARFSMPGGTENLYYSFNMGPVHFVSLNTEVYWFYEWYGKHQIVIQYEWFVKDLEGAEQQRKERPWIVIYGHRPMYCSSLSLECFSNAPTRNGLNRSEYALEPLFNKYGVDLVLSGHQHNYERFYPVYNYEIKMGENPYEDPRAPVHIVTGSAGCKEYIRYFWPWKNHISAIRKSDYGVSMVHFLNSTHMAFDHIAVNKDAIIDSFTLVKHHHGPYQ